MGPKSRKSGVLWLSCDACSCMINAKDVEVHQKSCPPPASNWEHGYVRDNVLHANLQDMDDKATLAKVPAGYTEKVVLLSQSAMQLCDLVIGSHVKVVCGDRVGYRKAWPTTEGSLTSVRLAKAELEFEWGCKCPSNQVTVSAIQSPPSLARRIVYCIRDFENAHTKSDLLVTLLRGMSTGSFLYVGMWYKVTFYGRELHIQITDVLPIRQTGGDAGLPESMKRLTIGDDVFTPCDETEWVLQQAGSRGLSDDKEDTSPPVRIGGYKKILEELRRNIELTLSQKVMGKGHSCYGVLLYGVNGVGKTLIAKYLASTNSVPTIEIKGMELYSKYYGETEAKLRAAFERAMRDSPSIIVMDNVETLCPKKGSDQERRVSSTLISLFDDLKDRKVVVIATSSQPHDIDPCIRRPGRLESELEVQVPHAEDRFDILMMLVPGSDRLQSTLQSLANASHGFVGADLASVVSKAVCFAATDGRDSLSDEDLVRAHSLVKPSAMREVYVQVPNVQWDDIGGQEELKLKLQQAVEWPLKYPDSFKRLGIRPPRGVLMYGPPGCSKTLAAKALATESKINFLSVKGSDIFSKWVGESERAMRDIFKRARSVAPAIVFLDELDALGGERGDGAGSGGGAVQERVLSQLLTELDGVQPLEDVIIIAATNRPDRIDKALLRPGRLDRLIYVPLPTRETRKQIFTLKFSKMPVDDNVNIDFLAQETEGYSGAEIVNICHDAAYKALEENMEASVISPHHFLAALKANSPRTPTGLLDLYKDYHDGRHKT
uniref:Spermatogenesis-associated protein 5 n=1 Tax=Lygus hesperus TaxID=30085 RepID=A0A146M8T5_LYGHE